MLISAFIKGQADNTYPAAADTVAGNTPCSPFIQQVVNSLVNLKASNPTSTQTIYTPLLAEVAQLGSASGAVTVANADNGQTAVGADWDYGSKVGSDGVLSPGEVSGTRNLSFNNPSNEAFTVTLNIVGNLARSNSSAGSSLQMSRAARRASDTSSGSTSPSANVGALTSLVFRLTYNPLLNTVTIQMVSPWAVRFGAGRRGVVLGTREFSVVAREDTAEYSFGYMRGTTKKTSKMPFCPRRMPEMNPFATARGTVAPAPVPIPPGLPTLPVMPRQLVYL